MAGYLCDYIAVTERRLRFKLVNDSIKPYWETVYYPIPVWNEDDLK